jgi:hypothetical protein
MTAGYCQSGGLHDEALGLAAVVPSRSLHWRGQVQPPASGRDGLLVVDLGLDRDNVTRESSFSRV